MRFARTVNGRKVSSALAYVVAVGVSTLLCGKVVGMVVVLLPPGILLGVGVHVSLQKRINPLAGIALVLDLLFDEKIDENKLE